jgi:hypothetical protein
MKTNRLTSGFNPWAWVQTGGLWASSLRLSCHGRREEEAPECGGELVVGSGRREGENGCTVANFILCCSINKRKDIS